LAQGRGISIGSAARPELLKNSRYRNTLATEFNMVTPENAMKWPTVQPKPGRYDFRAADALVAFAQRHRMVVRAHNLVTGGNNVPNWLLLGRFSHDELTNVLHQHITTEVSHFRGRVAQWDVVNEGLAVGGGLDDNLWLRGLGRSYIDMAFRWAHEADPNVLLFYNEDDIACDTCNGPFPAAAQEQKDNAIYNLVAGLKGRGVPIDGVGIQMHLSASPPNVTTIANFMTRLRGLGLQVAITEMDVRLPNAHTRQDLDREAEVYGDVLRTCLAAPNCKTFVTWGFTDAVSWIPTALPGFGTAALLDRNYRPKPAYYALQRVLQAP
jgi:endo-1,4-beta-xylanase